MLYRSHGAEDRFPYSRSVSPRAPGLPRARAERGAERLARRQQWRASEERCGIRLRMVARTTRALVSAPSLGITRRERRVSSILLHSCRPIDFGGAVGFPSVEGLPRRISGAFIGHRRLP